MKKINTVLKIILSVILIMPVLGAFGIFPEPTADMYNNAEAFAFIQILMNAKYLMIMMSGAFLISLICLWTKRIALASILLLPISLNIMGFHAFLDGGLFTGGAMMGNILFLINIYFLWYNRNQILPLLRQIS
jgi:putative oxidoreductase